MEWGWSQSQWVSRDGLMNILQDKAWILGNGKDQPDWLRGSKGQILEGQRGQQARSTRTQEAEAGGSSVVQGHPQLRLAWLTRDPYQKKQIQMGAGGEGDKLEQSIITHMYKNVTM